jgi:hypothetical protein
MFRTAPHGTLAIADPARNGRRSGLQKVRLV